MLAARAYRGGTHSSGRRTACRNRSAVVAAASGVASSHTMTNSSPPYRATESPARATDRRREATSASTSSPTRWPRLSLIALKPSRSTNTTESGR